MGQDVVAFEGIDQVGKRTVTNATITRLVEMGYTIAKSDHPNYWISPVRQMNRVHPGMMRVLKQAEENGGDYRVAQLRAAHYALDRTFSMAIYAQLTQTYPQMKIVSNRLVLSNAVTAGYARFSGEIQAHQVSQFIQDTILPNEKDLLDAYNITNFLCINGHADHKHSIHRPLDVYEIPGAQEMGAQAYESLFQAQAEYGLDIRKLVTRNGNEWRDIDDTVAEVIDQMGFTMQLNETGQGGQLLHVGPQTFADTFTPKRLLARTHHELWEKVTCLTDAWQDMVMTADREELDIFEMQRIAPALKQLISCINPADLQIDLGACNTVARLFDNYPELVDLVRAGHEEHGESMVNFLEGLAAQSREI